MILGIKKFEQQLLGLPDYETIEGETRYYKIPDGNFPSMTSLLKVLDDNGIEGWIKRVGEEEAQRIVTEASERGNQLHDLSERYLLNKLEMSDIKGKARFMFNKNKRHLDKVTKVYGIEEALYSKTYGYAGRVDAIVQFEHNGKKLECILDHKNSRNAIDMSKSYARRKIFKYMLQTVGYSIALEEMTGFKTTHGVLVVANLEQMNSSLFVFELKDYLVEFYKLVAIYKGKLDLKESLFWKL